jgi:hypothetical protein
VAVERNDDRQATGRGEGVRSVHARNLRIAGRESDARRPETDPTLAEGRVNRREALLDARRHRK